MSEPLYFEQKVAMRLGISSPDFKYLRTESLKKKVGWLMHGRDVVLTQEGLDSILKRLRASCNALPADLDFSADCVPDNSPSAKKEGPADGESHRENRPGQSTNRPDRTDESNGTAPTSSVGQSQLVELTVHRIYPNPRLLQATTAAGTLVDVGVKSNRNFRPFDHKGQKMTLQARLVRPGRYEMEGRCPRFPGRY